MFIVSSVAGKSQLLEHLHSDYTEPVRDPLWRHIYLSRGLESVITSSPFQKLGRIKQLGPTYLVYPGATHNRLAHSLGVFHLSKRVLIAILSHHAGPDVSLEGVRAFLCAALLHDLGHYPFAHSLKELPLAEHETLTGDAVVEKPLAGLIRGEIGSRPEFVAAIVDKKRDYPPHAGEVELFRNILSGVLDPDKLDYLNRDAYFCGVPYGVQDIDFVINKMRPHPKNGIAIEEQGTSAVENILFSRYLMYRSVYWHKTVRIATAMIKKAVYLAIRDGVIRPTSLYNIDDEEFFSIFAEMNYPPAVLIRQVFERRLLKSVWEVRFDPENPKHRRLLDLETRTTEEARIAGRLSKENASIAPESVVIDIPEPNSFEIDLPVACPDGFHPFSSVDSVFEAPVVKRFSQSLRKLRVILPQSAAASGPQISEILEIG